MKTKLNGIVALALALAALGASLSACVPLLATSGAAATMSVIDRRTMGAQIEDQSLQLRGTRLLKQVLPGDDNAYANVNAYNRRVLITGLAPSEAARQRAGELAATLENVRELNNELQVGTPAQTPSSAGDTGVTAAVKAQFLKSDVDVSTIKVVTEARIVYLMGMVTEREGRAAAQVASRASGVRKVVTLFDYITEEQLADLQRRNSPPAEQGSSTAR
ncbi:MAG: BON domain-containing protein [Burkholderiales bacterium]|nr:BON domain-containing protein [Burkholderiales bacterium]